jgi:hypothetical protein
MRDGPGTREHCAEPNTGGGEHVRRVEEGHGGAISCGDVGRAKHELTTGGNLNLRRGAFNGR